MLHAAITEPAKKVVIIFSSLVSRNINGHSHLDQRCVSMPNGEQEKKREEEKKLKGKEAVNASNL